MRGYLKGTVDETLALSTLAAKTLVSTILDDTVTEKTRISSIEASWSMSEFTIAAGDGPIVVGVAHSDYTDAEIEAVIETTGSWSQGDKVQQEIANRLVRIVGVMEAAAGGTIGAAVLNDGNPIKTKLNWSLITGQTLKLWAYNTGTSALATSDPQVKIYGHANLFV